MEFGFKHADRRSQTNIARNYPTICNNYLLPCRELGITDADACKHKSKADLQNRLYYIYYCVNLIQNNGKMVSDELLQ